MKVYQDAASCPPITDEQRTELIERVKSGKIFWIDSLMRRAGITPEECASPKAKFPITIIMDLLTKGYEVNTDSFHPKMLPSEIYTLNFYNFAMKHGVPKDDIVEYIKYDREFKEKLSDINEKILNGDMRTYPAITVEDLVPLMD